MTPHPGQSWMRHQWRPGPGKINPLVELSQSDSPFQKRGPEDKMEVSTRSGIPDQAKVVPWWAEPNTRCRQVPTDPRRGCWPAVSQSQQAKLMRTLVLHPAPRYYIGTEEGGKRNPERQWLPHKSKKSYNYSALMLNAVAEAVVRG